MTESSVVEYNYNDQSVFLKVFKVCLLGIKWGLPQLRLEPFGAKRELFRSRLNPCIKGSFHGVQKGV